MLSYIGPGGGIIISYSFVAAIALALGALVLPVLLPWTLLWRLIYRKRRNFPSPFRKVVVLGLDGLDWRLVQESIKNGRLPHLAKLAAEGHSASLETVAPAITPAAWPSFMVGGDPSYHGIFDFITRDPRTYLPKLSSFEITEVEGGRSWVKRLLWRPRPQVRSLRKGTPFWHAVAGAGFEVTVLRVPVTFPPQPFGGRLLSGMCVPDLLGSQGVCSYYGTRDLRRGPRTGEFCELRFQRSVARTFVRGARDPRRPGRLLTLPMEVVKQHTPGQIQLRVDGQRITLKVGSLTGWVRLRFRAGLSGVRGMVQFYLGSVEPDVELYMSAVHLDPERPATPISHPKIFSDYLAKRLGSYGTLGLMEDTGALMERSLDEHGFLSHAWHIYGQRKAMLLHALDRAVDDLTICVFDTPDRVQHMFWRQHMQAWKQSPAPLSQARPSVIDDMLAEMDRLVGEVRSRLSSDSLLLVISDHGFTDFDRGVNLNSWLYQNGYLHLLPGATMGRDWLEGVDWERTRAYALGLAGIFFNILGREARGVVAPGEQCEDLARELSERLEALCDPERHSPPSTGDRPVRRVYVTARCYRGPHGGDGPDLIVGYGAGYRCSWECARGQITGDVFQDNTRAWSGDHCVDPSLVPGVLFTNARLPDWPARLIDIAPTVLDVFGILDDGSMSGKSLLRQRGDAPHGQACNC